MSFFYDLNKKLDSIRATPEVTHQQLNERDMGKPGKMFDKIAKDAGERYGSKAAGERVAGSVRNKLRDQGKLEEISDQTAYDVGHARAQNFLQSREENPDSRATRVAGKKLSKNIDKQMSRAGRLGKPDPFRPKIQGVEKGYAKGSMEVLKKPGEGEVSEDMYNQGGVYKEIEIEPKRPQDAERKMTRGTPANSMVDKLKSIANKPTPVDRAISKIEKRPEPVPPGARVKPEPKDNGMGRIVQGTWQADPKGKVPAPSGDPEGVPESSMRPRNFADKIADAKKEVDEMLGQVAAEAMRSALGGGRGRNAAMDEERSKGTAFDMSTPRVDTPKAGSTERGSKHDITHSTSDPRYKGRTVIRRTDAQGISVGGETDDEGNKKEKRTKAGRPDGTGKKIGAKGPSGNSKLITKVDEVDIRDQGEYDQEGDMAKNDIKTIVRHAQALHKVLGNNDNLPEWVQSKLAKIEDMMISVDEYMQNQDSDDGEEPIAEKAVSKKQQRFMGMVHSAQQGKKPASRAVGKVANTMKKSDAKDFASTKQKGLPEKAKKKEVDENSEDGRLTTTQTGTGQTSTSSSTGRISATVDKGTVSVKPAKSGSMSYGKGIYDSFNRDLELMIAESMSINMSDSTEGNKSLTITATDDDAMKLAMMLKSAGLGGGQDHGEDFANQLQHAEHNHPGAAFGGEEVCDTCGMQDCGCGDVEQAIDENSPDWPTNTEQADNNFGYAGGLNKPKTDIAGDGQTTVPVVATRPHNEEDALRRMMEMAGLAEAAKPDFLDINKNGDKEESMKDAAADVNEEEDTVEESIQRMREMAGIQEAKKQVDQNGDGKNDFEDIKIARMKASGAIKDKEEKKVDESIFALTNQWKAYKG